MRHLCISRYWSFSASAEALGSLMVLGVDLSIAKCGLALYDGELRVVGTVKTKQKLSRAAKRLYILERIKGLHKRYKFKKIVMERVNLFAGKGKRFISMDAIGALIGLSTTIEDWALLAQVEVEVVAVNHWRKVVLGDGRARKPEMVAYVQRKFKKDVGHDAADAVGLSLYPFKKGLEVANGQDS